MKQELYNFDIFPKVFPVNREVAITVKPQSVNHAFSGDYTVRVCLVSAGDPNREFNAGNTWDIPAAAHDGCLKFKYTAPSECEYFVRIIKEDRQVVQLSVYALEDDLACRIPLKGDLHMHTCRSDGREEPALVCANYRKIGYDFIVITDHGRYYPSLEAMNRYSEADMSLCILPGEEVHLPLTNVHIVNAGGKFSVNGVLDTSNNYLEKGAALETRSLDGNAPDIIPHDEYVRQIEELAASEECADCPDNVEKISYAVCLWAFKKIREGEGVGIFAHPYWIANMWHIAEPLTMYMMKKHPFDAFEVLGGENYYEQNGYQTALYYEEYKEGRVHPIVGSTDSHGSTEHNRNRDICSTIVFAKDNAREDILSAIKDKYSVAVDSISKEFRLVGEFRLQKYACFLMNNWFPIHDRIAEMDGELMREYTIGESGAYELKLMKNKADSMLKKYFVLA